MLDQCLTQAAAASSLPQQAADDRCGLAGTLTPIVKDPERAFMSEQVPPSHLHCWLGQGLL